MTAIKEQDTPDRDHRDDMDARIDRHDTSENRNKLGRETGVDTGDRGDAGDRWVAGMEKKRRSTRAGRK